MMQLEDENRRCSSCRPAVGCKRRQVGLAAVVVILWRGKDLDTYRRPAHKISTMMY
jgi:hypothetical protein